MTPPDPTLIMNLATGYWNSATLLAANELNLFGALAGGPRSAAEVAAQLGTDERATTLLLDACAGLELLAKETADGPAVYRNTPAASAYLVPGRPGYLGGAIRWSAGQYPLWGRLAAAVRAGEPAVEPGLHLGGDPEQTRAFVLGMHNRAQGMARGLLLFLDFAGVRRLLDVGGGPGTLSVLLAQKYPQLEAVVFDLPGIVAIAQELIAESGVADRVTTRPGNAIRDDYGVAEYDAVLFSGVLHQMAPATVQAMLAQARRALAPGGKVVLCDMMLDAAKTSPPFAALFSLQMLLTSREGAVFSVEECRAWLEQAGFQTITAQALPPPLPYTVVSGWA